MIDDRYTSGFQKMREEARQKRAEERDSARIADLSEAGPVMLCQIAELLEIIEGHLRSISRSVQR